MAGCWTPSLSAYAIKARHAADVAAGITFARANNLRLVVKGGGHSYLGTSNVIIADGYGLAFPGVARTTLDLAAARKDAHDIDLAAAELRKVAPNAGSYVSESNYFNRAWQNEYWGSNCARLRAIKIKYDPDGLFIVHHGVGSDDWSADGFTRLA